jgi:hypothetical protein
MNYDVQFIIIIIIIIIIITTTELHLGFVNCLTITKHSANKALEDWLLFPFSDTDKNYLNGSK